MTVAKDIQNDLFYLKRVMHRKLNEATNGHENLAGNRPVGRMVQIRLRVVSRSQLLR